MRRILQIVLVAAGALVALFGLLVAILFTSTSGLVRAADGFLAAVRAQDLAGASRFASEDFRASTSEDELRAFLERNRLSGIREARWSSRNRATGGRGTLEGVVATEDGRNVPLHVALVKEDGAWKVHALARPASGIVELGAAEGRPGPAEQVTLLRQSVHALAVALRTQDFEAFRAGVARVWQAQKSADEFRAIFSGAFRGDLTTFDRLEPELDQASTLEDGVLVVTARYQLGDGRQYFRCSYVLEGVAWRLVGIHADTKRLDP
jgi:hypothetical protein